MSGISRVARRAGTAATENSMDLTLISQQVQKVTDRLRVLLADEVIDRTEITELLRITEVLVGVAVEIKKEAADVAVVGDMCDEVDVIESVKHTLDYKGLAALDSMPYHVERQVRARRHAKVSYMREYEHLRTRKQTQARQLTLLDTKQTASVIGPNNAA